MSNTTEASLNELIAVLRRQREELQQALAKETARADATQAELNAIKTRLGTVIKLRECEEIWRVLDEVHGMIFVAAETGSAAVYDIKITLPAYSPDEMKLEVWKTGVETVKELGRVLCGDEGAPLARILANAKAVTATLDATQARCTEFQTENRELRRAEIARRGVGAIPSFRIAALDPPHAIATQESLDKMTRQLGLLRESIECLSNEAAYTAEKLKEMASAMGKGAEPT